MNKIQYFLKSFISGMQYDFFNLCSELQTDHVAFLTELNRHRDKVAYCRYDGKITLVHKG